jgi:hypothetical protein
VLPAHSRFNPTGAGWTIGGPLKLS